MRDCTDRLQCRVEIIKIRYDPPGVDHDRPNGEWVRLRNVSPAKVQLYGYLLESWPYGCAFGPRSGCTRVRP